MNQKDWEWEDLLAQKQKERDAALKIAKERKDAGASDDGPERNDGAIRKFPARPFDESSLEEGLEETDLDEAADKQERADGASEPPEVKHTGQRGKRSAFLIGYLIFVLVLVIIGFFFLRNVTKTMEEMRDNSGEEIVRAHLAQLTDAEIASLLPVNPDYEDPAETAASVRTSIDAGALILKRADRNLFDVYQGTDRLFQARLQTERSVSHLGLLNYDILSFAGFSRTDRDNLYRYEIIAPSSYEITVNGRNVGAPAQTSPVDGFGDAGEYVALPTVNTYVIADLTKEPVIRASADGREVPITLAPVIDLTADGAAGVRYDTFEETGIDFDAMGFAVAWNLFMTDDLGGDLHGYWQLSPYFIDGTSMQKKAYDWATGIDITLTSFHTEPVLSDERIYHVVRYGEDAASYMVHIAKEMTLTRTEEVKRDIFESTIYLVRVDGVWKVANVRGAAEE